MTTTDLPRPVTGALLAEIASQAPAEDDSTTGLPVHRAFIPVAFYPADGEDGHDVTVLVSRWPADFYRIDCPGLGLSLSTASDMADLAHQVAQALSAGELGHAHVIAGDAPLARPTDAMALDAITATLSGAEFNADSFTAVADIICETGRTIADTADV